MAKNFNLQDDEKSCIFVTKDKRQVIIRSSHERCPVNKGVLGNFTKFIWKHLRQRLFFKKIAGLRPVTLLKRLWHWCFPVNFTKFLRAPFLQNTSGRLLLYYFNNVLHRIFTAKAVWDFLFLIVIFKLLYKDNKGHRFDDTKEVQYLYKTSFVKKTP